MKRVMLLVVLVASAVLWAQDGPPTPPPGQGPGGQWRGTPRMQMRGGERMRMPGPAGMPGGGKWWKNSEVVQNLGLSDAQVQQIEKSFQDHRLQLVDLHAALEKAEIGLEPMMQAEQPNEAQVIVQIDKIAQARAALEKSNAQMLLGVRRILTVDQWKKLQARQERRPARFGPEGMPQRMPRRGPGGTPRPGTPPAPAGPADIE